MPLIIENGSIVPGANSYVAVAEARAYVESRGGLFPVEDIDGEYKILEAMDYLESHREQFKGDLVRLDQPLGFPRNNFYAEDWLWPSTEIPRQVLNAVLALVFEVCQGKDLYNPESEAPPAIKKKVGPIETVYAQPARVSKVYKNTQSQVLMKLLIKDAGLRPVRV